MGSVSKFRAGMACLATGGTCTAQGRSAPVLESGSAQFSLVSAGLVSGDQHLPADLNPKP